MRNIAERVGLVLLFIFDACCVFIALGLLSFGTVALPSVLLGRRGVLTVTTDLAPTALLLICAGALLLGAGMCIGVIPLLSSSYEAYRRVVKKAALTEERGNDEEGGTS